MRTLFKKTEAFILKKCFKSLFVTLLVLSGLIMSTTTVFSEVINCVCAECGRPCGSGHSSTCSYSSGNTGGGGGGEGGGGGLFNLIDRWQERAEAAAAKRRAEGYKQNQQGVEEYKRGNYAEALRLFRQAHDNNPDDKVISQNIKNAEAEVAKIEQEKKRQEELRGEQADYSKRMKKLAALMPVTKNLPQSASGQTTGLARVKVPLPGFSTVQWKDYLDAQNVVDRLYAKLNREGALSDADSKEFYAALRRRNELWTLATEQPLTSEERDRLRLSLPVVVNKAIMDLTLIMQGIQPNSQNNVSKPETARPVISPDRRKDSEADAITNAFVADFFTDKITKLSENEVGSTIENVHGEKMKNRYENLIGVGKVAVKAIKGGRSEAGAETADLIISKIPNQTVSARAEHAVEGGRMYSNVACRTLNRFMVDAMNATGNSFDTEAFWKRFNEDRTESQKGVKKWIQFCE